MRKMSRTITTEGESMTLLSKCQLPPCVPTGPSSPHYTSVHHRGSLHGEELVLASPQGPQAVGLWDGLPLTTGFQQFTAMHFCLGTNLIL